MYLKIFKVSCYQMHRGNLCVEQNGFPIEIILLQPLELQVTPSFDIENPNSKDSSEGQNSEKHIKDLLVWPNESSKNKQTKPMDRCQYWVDCHFNYKLNGVCKPKPPTR